MLNKEQSRAITHDGPFHADDVFAAAILELINPDVEIIRTRNPDIIATGDVVFDVGGTYDPQIFRYDHHMANPPCRPDSTPYSSAGLIWRDFGVDLVRTFLPDASLPDVLNTANTIDRDLITMIDRADNGVEQPRPSDITSIIGRMNSTWNEPDDAPLADHVFMGAVRLAQEVLRRFIAEAKSEIEAEAMVWKANRTARDPRIITLDKSVPFQATVFKHDLEKILYVISPYGSKGNWGVTAVPDKLGSFGTRKPLPKEWAGLTDGELQAVTGVSDAIFAHRNLFFAVAATKEGAFRLTEIALRP